MVSDIHLCWSMSDRTCFESSFTGGFKNVVSIFVCSIKHEKNNIMPTIPWSPTGWIPNWTFVCYCYWIGYIDPKLYPFISCPFKSSAWFTLPKTNSKSPWKIGRNPQGNDHVFQVHPFSGNLHLVAYSSGIFQQKWTKCTKNILQVATYIPLPFVSFREQMGVSLNGGTPKTPLKGIMFSGKTSGCWVPPF